MNGAPTLDIVIADDSLVIRDLLQELLSFQPGCRIVEVFEDGQETVDWAAKGGRADICIVDMRLPGLSGAETIRALRAALPRARLIAFSASAQQQSIIAAMEAGADSYLLKDAPLTALLAALEGENSFPDRSQPRPAIVARSSADDYADADHGRRAAAIARADAAPPDSLRVVVIDDHALVRNATRVLLENGGDCQVIEFEGGEHAIAWFEQGRCADAALIDMRLSDMSGGDVAARLRELCPNTALLLHTGSADYETTRAGGQVDVDAVLVKGSYKGGDLVARVRDAIARRSSA